MHLVLIIGSPAAGKMTVGAELARLTSTPPRTGSTSTSWSPLLADQETRLAREGTPYRLEHKRTKRDVEWCRDHLLDMDARHRFASEPDEHLGPGRHLRCDDSGDDPEATARAIAARLSLE